MKERKKRPLPCTRGIIRGGRTCILRRSRWRWVARRSRHSVAGCPQRATTWEVMGARRRPRDGGGLPSMIRVARWWRRSVDDARTRSFASCQRCWRPVVAPGTPQTGAVRMRVMGPLRNTRMGRGRRSRPQASIHLRTRITWLVRRTIGCSPTEPLHAPVIGLCITRYACGRLLCEGIHPCATPSSPASSLFLCYTL